MCGLKWQNNLYPSLVTQARGNRSGQSGHGLTSFGSSVLKGSYNELKGASIFILVTGFLIYLTAFHNMGLAKIWLTQGLTVTWYTAQSRSLWLMDLVTVLTIMIFLNYCLAWMWHLLLQLVDQWLLHQNLCQIMVKPPIGQRRFCFWNVRFL